MNAGHMEKAAKARCMYPRQTGVPAIHPDWDCPEGWNTSPKIQMCQRIDFLGKLSPAYEQIHTR